MGVTEFKLNKKIVTDQKQIVNRFNDYFANVGLELARKIHVDTNLTFKGYLKGNYKDSLFLSPVCEPEVKKKLECLDTSKSCGHDNIMPRVVKYLATELAAPLTHIINFTFVTWKIRTDLKTAIIVLVYKAGDKQEFNNYRPLFLLPCFSKVLDKIMHKN